MAGKRQETIPLLAGCGIPLTATGLALLCSSYYVLIGEQCMEKQANYPLVRLLNYYKLIWPPFTQFGHSSGHWWSAWVY